MSVALQLSSPTGTAGAIQEATRARLKGRVAAALEALHAIVEAHPDDASAHVELGMCHLQLREYDNALRHFDRALEVAADDGRAFYGAAMSLFELGRFEESVRYASRMSRLLDPESQARGLYIIGLVEHARGAWLAAAVSLERSLEIDPHRRRSKARAAGAELRHRTILAECYRELGRDEDALRHFLWTFRKTQRPGRSLRLGLADVYLALRKFPECREQLEAVLADAPDDRDALLLLGRHWAELGQHANSILAYQRVLHKDQQDPDALAGMVEAYKARGEVDRVIGYVQQMEQGVLRPERQRLRRDFALAHERAHRDADLFRARNLAALNVMATGVAHELRQPLSVIRLAAQSARRDLERGRSARVCDDLAEIDEGVVRLDRIIELLRLAARGDTEVQEDVDVAAALADAMLLFEAQLRHRSIAFEDAVPPRVVASGNRVAVQQIFMNLIGNARDALTDVAEKRIRVSAEERDGRVFVRVEDTGCGMLPATLEHVMEPFFTTKGSEGTGLGLFLSSSLARKMGGSLEVLETRPGRGTTFELSLPLGPAKDGANRA